MVKTIKTKYTVNVRVHFNKEEHLKLLEKEIEAYVMASDNWLDEKGRRYRDRIAKVEVNIIEKENIDDLPIIIEPRIVEVK